MRAADGTSWKGGGGDRVVDSRDEDRYLSEADVHGLPPGSRGAQGERGRLRLGRLLSRPDSQSQAQRTIAENGNEAARSASHQGSDLQGVEAWRTGTLGQSNHRPDGRASRSHSAADCREGRASHSRAAGGTGGGNLVIQNLEF